MKEPKGVIAVLVSSDGVEIANAADFSLSRPGGFSLQEAQERRARTRLASRTMRELASPRLSDSIEEYMAEQIIRKMCDNGKHRLVIIPIGHES